MSEGKIFNPPTRVWYIVASSVLKGSPSTAQRRTTEAIGMAAKLHFNIPAQARS
jgi:hypothetical protein